MKTELTGLVEFGSGRPERRHPDDLRQPSSCRSGSSAAGRLQRGLAQRGRGRLPARARRGGAEGAARRPHGARPGDAYVEENKASLDEILGFLQTFLLVFAAVSLVVGVFLIINTFSILVAQRSRELALLRAMGASRRQVNRSVLLEATAVGLVGSTVGLGVGYLLALGLRWLFGVFGLDLSRAEFPMTWSAVVLVVRRSAWASRPSRRCCPARRAARIAPIAALRDDVALPESTHAATRPDRDACSCWSAPGRWRRARR